MIKHISFALHLEKFLCIPINNNLQFSAHTKFWFLFLIDSFKQRWENNKVFSKELKEQ